MHIFTHKKRGAAKLRFDVLLRMREWERKLPFVGVRVTLFHWTHNQRVYVGLLNYWRPSIIQVPYAWGKSAALRKRERPMAVEQQTRDDA